MAWYLKRPRRAPQQETVLSATIPAPMGGINLVDSPESLAPADSPFLLNLVPSSGGGVTVRYGTRDHATGVGAGNVNTLVSFTGGSSADSKMFAASSAGIHDITSAGAASLKVAYGTTTGSAGFGVAHSFTTIAGEFCLLCDEENGYHVYTQSTDTWAAVASGTGAAQVSGIDPANAVFVTGWKNRVWLVEKGTANGWYLPVGQIYGIATKFNFGSRFSKGGELVGLWPWTIDGGRGVDDYLVAVSSAGELLIFEGTDPDTVDAFNLVGAWDLGAVYGGRRCAYNYNGDVVVLTRAGLVSVSQVRSGMGLDVASQITRKIQPEISSNWSSSVGSCWFVENPGERALTLQFSGVVTSLSKASLGWFPYSFAGAASGGIYSAVVHNGVVYWGLSSGRVHGSYPGNDDQASNGSGGTEQSWGFVSGPAVKDFVRYKTISAARVRFLGSAPTFGVGARYSYQSGSTAAFGAPTTGGAANGWSGVLPYDGTAGASPEAYLTVAGSGSATLSGVDVLVQLGGVT